MIAFARKLTAESGVAVSGLNFGGGLGIPYHPDEPAFDTRSYAANILSALDETPDWAPQLVMECGRFVTGPSGYLVAQVNGVFEKPHRVIGINVSTAAMPRVSVYPDAYHHISFPDAKQHPKHPTDVVGAMCESSDKFCLSRSLPTPGIGDLCLIHDVGAHCIGMSNTYNGMLRPAEFLLDGDRITMIARPETFNDLAARFTNAEFERDVAECLMT